MSARRSGRAKAPVKYTSDSEDSDFSAKQTRKSGMSARQASRKRTKAEQDPSAEHAATPKKRTKKDPETLAVEHREKAQAQEAKAQKAQHKKSWDDWLGAHDVAGELLDEEPAREESITQTDSLKKYGLKKEELSNLKHFEKRNPLYNNTIKLYLEIEVKLLAFRKYGMLEGVDDEKVLEKGEEIWKEVHKDTDHDTDPSPPSNSTPKKTTKPKTPKQTWTAYVESHTISTPSALTAEPEESINQSDSKAKYSLTPGDLVVLPYFPKPNSKYGNTTKLFKESEVKSLAYRKAAVLGNVDEEDDGTFLEKGKELFEKEK